MDPAETLLSDLRARGVRLSVAGASLRYEARTGVMTPALLAGLREHKPALLALLSREDLQPRANPEAPVPASRAQARFWFLASFERETSFNIVVIEPFVELTLDALQRSLDEIVRRHEILRNTIVEIGGEPHQRLALEAHVVIERRAASGATPEERRSSAGAIIARERQAVIDLAKGPVLRAVLVAVSESEHLLGLIVHHAAFDGESGSLLLQELRALYGAFSNGQPSPLAELPIQYADYAAFERRWVETDAGRRQLAYWMETLSGAPELALPTDRPRPAVKGTRSAVLPVTLSSTLGERIEQLASMRLVSPAMVLLAAYDALLARWSNQDDLVVGLVVAGRSREQLARLIGPLVNNLAIRVSLAGDPSFAELLQRVSAALLAGYANQQMPFEQVVEAINPPRDPSRTPLFQVAFNFVQGGAAGARTGSSGETQLGAIAAGSGRWRFDLYWQFVRSADGRIGGRLEYDTDLFEHATIERFVSQYVSLLEAAVADPARPVSTLPLMTEDERRSVLSDWNATDAAFPSERCLHELIAEQARRAPDATAVSFGDERWTYAELEARSNRLARRLRAEGVGPNVFVAVYMERSLEMVASLLAILKAGGAYVPVDPEYPRERVVYMLEDAGAPVLLTQARLLASLPRDLPCVLAVDEAWSSLPDDDSPLAPLARPGDLAYMIYTSGSTGRPKGARNAHTGIVNRLWWMQERYRLTREDRVLQKTPFSFDVSVWELFWPLLAGAELVVARPGGHRDPSYLAQLIRARAITTVHFVPSMLRIFVSEPTWKACTSLRRVVCSGEALPPDLAEELLAGSASELHNLYGPTEAAVDVTSWQCERGARTVPIGRPIANVQTYVLDERLAPVPIGLTGEIFIGGVGVGLGYHDRPGLTAASFVPDPFSGRSGARLYRTGDHGRWRVDGAIEYVGRIDGQVKVRGFRIELGEIESAVRACAGVTDATVVVRESTPGDKRMVAYVVGASASADALRTELRARLPEYMVPNAFVLLPALPLNPSGKIDRKALPAPDFGKGETEYVAPRTPMEETVAEIWQTVLKVERVGVHDDFFRLGGHSLLVMRIVGLLRDALQRDVPVRTVFESSTVAELAARLSEDAERPRPPPIERGDVETGEVLSYSQEVFVAFERDRPPSGTWTTPIRLRLRGPLDRAALDAAVEQLLTRQEGLRLAVDLGDGREDGLYSVDDIRVKPVDMRGRTEDEVRAYCNARAKVALRGPLIELELLERGDGDHELMVLFHQLVHDPTADVILLRELLELYASRVERREPRLPDVPVRYVDFAVWRRRWYEGGGRAEVEAARRRLDGVRGVELPTDHPRQGHVSPACVTVPFRIEAETASRFAQMCQAASVTLFMGFAAVTAAFLAAWSGQEDIAFLTPVNLRGLLPDIENVIGRFLNFTAVCLSVGDDPSIGELLGRTRAATLAAYEHSMAPAQLVFGTPLIYDHPVLRVLLNTPEVKMAGAPRTPRLEAKTTYGGLVVERESVPIPSGARNDVAIVLAGGAGGLYGAVRGATDLFEPSTIERKSAELAELVRALDRDRRLSELPGREK